MTLDEMKTAKATLEIRLKELRGNSAVIKRARANVKSKIEKLDMMIFKAEAPEQSENYKLALQGYVDNTHII